MGRKGFNWRARQVVDTVIDNSSTKKIQLDESTVQNGSYDASNALVLPSEKRKTKVKKGTVQVTRILSKKQRKHLENIVNKKKRKENHQQLLEALEKVRATPAELDGLVSITSIQTKGLRHFQEDNTNKRKAPAVEQGGDICINAIKGAKRLRLQHLQEETNSVKENDPNVVGFESDSDSCTEEDEDDPINNEAVTEDLTKKAAVPEKPVEIKDEVQIIKESPRITQEKKKATYVQVVRDEAIQTARLKLPILGEEQQIMELIAEHSVVIIAGETGSGKTTQLPQFLYEAGYALNGQIIGITEPRRVAAISMSRRVGVELDLPEQVSYLIRFEGNATDATRIKFMTDGVLLKEIQHDFLLSKYSVVILDEAHERSAYTDILVGLLSRIVPLRNRRFRPLKLIIMSATLRVEDFTHNERLFRIPPPVVNVEARQFPVTVHFNKRTPENYLREAYAKACKVHARLPDGGILIFVTGQQEVRNLVRKLRAAYPKRNAIAAEKKTEDGRRKRKVKILPKISLDDYSMPQVEEDEEIDGGSDGQLSDDDEDDFSTVTLKSDQPLWVLPLYSLLPSDKQAMIFAPPPTGCRLCVVATNVAETSLTIPGVKYVIDTGKTKVKLYDKVTGVTSYVVHWTSRASADQRAGRAGRTAPGHCYRLYSSAVFNDVFVSFAKPEIQEKPVDDLYLQMKCMRIDKVVNFPFPTAPDLMQLKSANHRLRTLGALDSDSGVTDLGRAIAKFPVLPRYGKMLALSHQGGLLPYTILLVAALSVQEVLSETPVDEKLDAAEIRKKWFAKRMQWAGTGNSKLLGDAMVLLKAVGASEYAHQQGRLETFAAQNGLRLKALGEIRKLRLQLTNDIKASVPDAELSGVDPHLKPPDDHQARLLRQIVLAGNGDHVARKIRPDEVKDTQDKVKYKYAYYAMDMEEPVWLHQGSVLKRELPEFVVYMEIYETNKMYMRGVTAIEVEWLVKYVPELCNLSEPLTDPEPIYNESKGCVQCTVTGSFGMQNWKLPHCLIDYRHALGAYKWFARFLLEGKVIAKIARYTKSLLSAPSLMIRAWAKLQPRTDALLKALMNARVCCRSELIDAWEKDSKFLLKEFLMWLPESAHAEVTLSWPPLEIC